MFLIVRSKKLVDSFCKRFLLVRVVCNKYTEVVCLKIWSIQLNVHKNLSSTKLSVGCMTIFVQRTSKQ